MDEEKLRVSQNEEIDPSPNQPCSPEGTNEEAPNRPPGEETGEAKPWFLETWHSLTEEEQEEQIRVAQAKFTIVAPVILKSHTEKSDHAFLVREAEKTHLIPGMGCRQFGVSTMEGWIKSYRQYGDIRVLIRKKRSDQGEQRVLSEVAKTRILQILSQVPKAHATVIHSRLCKEKVIQENEVSVDTIRRYINAENLREMVMAGVKEETFMRYSFRMEAVGHMYECDSCYFTKIPVGEKYRWVYVQAIVDDYSRKILACRCYMNDNRENFLLTLRWAIARYGIPKTVYLDNGSPYVSKELLEACSKMKIAVIHTRSNDGASKGCVERLFKTMEGQTILELVLDQVATLEGVQEKVDEWATTYNHKVNTGVGGRPADLWDASAKKNGIRAVPSEEWLQNAFTREVCRVISNTGTVQQNNLHFRIPDEVRKGYRRKKINVFFDPSNVKESIYVIYLGKKFSLILDDPLENSTRKRERGGRKAQLEEQARAKKEKRMTLADQRAEERYRSRMAGTDILRDADKKAAAEEALQANDPVSAEEISFEFSCAGEEIPNFLQKPLEIDYTVV